VPTLELINTFRSNSELRKLQALIRIAAAAAADVTVAGDIKNT
jgi:hypothetical protein